MSVKIKKMVRFIPLYFMALPGLIYLTFNNYIPMAGVVIAFKNLRFSKKGLIDSVLNSKWVGFDNFTYLFKTKDAWIITRNTLFYNVGFIIIGTLMAVMVAIFINDLKSKKLATYFQSALLLPYLISMVVVSYLGYAFLSSDTGFINNTLLKWFGKDGISWYTKAEAWPFILIFINNWKNIGYLTIVYLAAIIGIDPAYYEAASLDGATKIQKITKITIPLIKPVIVLMVLLAIGRIFYSDFGLFYQVPMNSGPLYPTTNVIDTYVYRGLMQLGDISMSSATGLYQSAVGFILVIVSNFIVKKVDPDSSLF